MTTDRGRAKAEAKKVRAERIQQQWSEHYDDLVDGEMTLAQILDHDDGKLMEVADLGLALMKVGKYEQARKILVGLPLLDPYVPYFHLLLGQLYEKMQRSWEGVSEYDAAIELCESMDPPARLLPHSLLCKAKAMARMKQFDEADRLVNRLVSGELHGVDARLQRDAQGLAAFLKAARGAASGVP